MKKLVSMAVAIMLIAGCMNVGLSEARGSENWFIPEQFTKAFNDGLYYYTEKIFAEDGDKAYEVFKSLCLAYSETEDGFVYYNDMNWDMELSGYYEDRIPDRAIPAKAITFSVDASYDAKVLAVVELALGTALCVLDDSAEEKDFDVYLDLLAKGWDEGYRTLEKGKYTLLAMYYEPRCMLSILHN